MALARELNNFLRQALSGFRYRPTQLAMRDRRTFGFSPLALTSSPNSVQQRFSKTSILVAFRLLQFHFFVGISLLA